MALLLLTGVWTGVLIAALALVGVGAAALFAANYRRMLVRQRDATQRRDLTPHLGPAWHTTVLALVFVTAVSLVVFLLLTWLLNVPTHVSSDSEHPVADRRALSDVFKAALAVAAGIGAVVALALNYRRHRIEESQSHRDDQRLFTDRFQSAAEQLGHGRAAVRLAGVHAMARLADDWDAHRQTCIDVLCACIRLPPDAAPTPHAAARNEGAEAADGGHTALSQSTTPPDEREIRQTIVRVIADHLKREQDEPASWRGRDFDFTGVVIDSGTYDFSDVTFSGGTVAFTGATFSGGSVSFSGAKFSGGVVDFDDATFSGGSVSFSGAKFSRGSVGFHDAQFSGSAVGFYLAEFSGPAFDVSEPPGDADDDDAWFPRGTLSFSGAKFSDGVVSFDSAMFSGGALNFDAARFTGGAVEFHRATFSAGRVRFAAASYCGGVVDFRSARFEGGTVDLRSPSDETLRPVFDERPTVPAGVVLHADGDTELSSSA